MVGIMTLPRTTIGKKVIMALSGLVWIGYLAGHMYGNLKIFTGAEHFNEYAEGLRTIGAPIFGYSQLLWVIRIVLILSIFGHVWAAVSLSRLNKRESRPHQYEKHKKLRANSAQLTMIYGGVAILLFIIYHIMHITLGTPIVHPDFVPHDPYHNLVVGFQSQGSIPVAIYLIALVFIGMHLYHGAWSTFQTLGLNNKNYTKLWRGLSVFLAIVIPVGFALVPLAILFGIVS